jgi:hypothetical protein
MSNAPRHDLGATFASVDTLWVPFGSCWFFFWLHFEFCTVPFRSLWLAFGSQISERTFGTLSAKHPEKIPGTLAFAPHRPKGPDRNLAAGKFD